MQTHIVLQLRRRKVICRGNPQLALLIQFRPTLVCEWVTVAYMKNIRGVFINLRRAKSAHIHVSHTTERKTWTKKKKKKKNDQKTFQLCPFYSAWCWDVFSFKFVDALIKHLKTNKQHVLDALGWMQSDLFQSTRAKINLQYKKAKWWIILEEGSWHQLS